MAKWSWMIAAALVTGSTADARASSFRCGSELIGEGDTVLELQAACGAPDHVDRRTIVQSVAVPGLAATEVSHLYEELETWTYTGGGGKLMRVVEVRRGKITAIRTVAVRGPRDLKGCTRAVFGEPALSGQVELTCGLPDDRSRWVEERVIKRRDGLEQRVIVTHERWFYVPGPGMLIRIFDFENGRLVRESTGARAPSE